MLQYLFLKLERLDNCLIFDIIKLYKIKEFIMYRPQLREKVIYFHGAGGG